MSVTGQSRRAASPREAETPFRILVLGDFSGRSNRQVSEPLGARVCRKIDIDNFDDVLARLQPQLELALPSGPLHLAFTALDDFHPDRLFARIALFRELRGEPGKASPAPGEAASKPESNRAMFERLLGEAPANAPAKKNPVQELIAQAVEPHIVPPADPSAGSAAAATDLARTALMRVLLHDPSFKALEAAWRGLDSLVRNVETEEGLEISLLDVSKSEFVADLREHDDLAESGFFKKIVQETIQTPGANPWSLIVADYFFSSEEADVHGLARAGKIAEAAGAPILTSIESALVDAAISRDGMRAPLWSALRQLPFATSIGMAAPQILLRLPYGKATDPIDSFPFEELEDPTAQPQFLWGNPAFAIARLIAQSFAENGWDFTPGDTDELADLPHHTWRGDGEAKMTPCAERWLTDVEGERLLDSGIMPLLSIRGRNAVKVPRIQSLADPPAPLRGAWEG